MCYIDMTSLEVVMGQSEKMQNKEEAERQTKIQQQNQEDNREENIFGLEVLEEFLIYCQSERHLAQLTLQAYETDLKNLLWFMSKVRGLDAFDKWEREDIVKWLVDLKDTSGLCDESIRRYKVSMRRFVVYLHDNVKFI